MIRSMTGYGRNTDIVDGYDIMVEIKSVNHRYFELSSRVPRVYGYLEDKIKQLIQSKVSRGKIDVNITVFCVGGQDASIEINESLAEGYVTALRRIGEKLSIAGDITLSDICRFSDVFTVKKISEDDEIVWNAVKSVCEAAIDSFIVMRETEGVKLKDDVETRLKEISKLIGIVEERSPKTIEEYRNKLFAKMADVLKDTKIDEQRILTEAAIYGERIAVDEETVRLRSHIQQFLDILNSDVPVGRKLDFLIQEINREVNTIGSKASDIEIAKIVVEIKSEIEKIREQIQNME